MTCKLNIITVACADGTYRAGDMTTCQTCPAEKEPNADKTECGKEVFREISYLTIDDKKKQGV